MKTLDRIIGEVVAEWGIRDHEPEMRITIFSEELGEASHGVLNLTEEYRRELIHIAAAVIAATECFERLYAPEHADE